MVRLDTHSVIDGATQFLPATEVTLRRLDRRVPAGPGSDPVRAGEVAEPRTTATEVVRCRSLASCPRRGGTDDLPERCGRYANLALKTTLVSNSMRKPITTPITSTSTAATSGDIPTCCDSNRSPCNHQFILQALLPITNPKTARARMIVAIPDRGSGLGVANVGFRRADTGYWLRNSPGLGPQPQV